MLRLTICALTTLIAFHALAKEQTTGTVRAFVTEDNQLVVEIIGEAASSLEKFFNTQPYQLRALDAALPSAVRIGINKASIRANTAGIRAGRMLGLRAAMIRANGLRVPAEDDYDKEAISKTVPTNDKNSLREFENYGLRRNGIVYRIIFPDVGSGKLRPYMGKVSWRKSTDGKNLDFAFSGDITQLFSQLKAQNENYRIKCVTTPCSLTVGLKKRP